MTSAARFGSAIPLLITSCLIFLLGAQSASPQEPTAAPEQQTQQPASSSEPKQKQQEPSTEKSTPKPSIQPTMPANPSAAAWDLLDAACASDKPGERANGVRALGLVPDNARALKVVLAALTDEKPDVRAAAAEALGEMKAKSAISPLRSALDDDDPHVVLAAAHSLYEMHDPEAYETYYEILTGERKATRGLIASQKARLSDPKQMAELGVQQGIGFIPFAGIGWQAIKTLTKDDTSKVRASAAKTLAEDPDEAATKALRVATGDDQWLVRAAALEALAHRGDPNVLDVAIRMMSDDKEEVKLSAAATVLRLEAIKNSRTSRRSSVTSRTRKN